MTKILSLTTAWKHVYPTILSLTTRWKQSCKNFIWQSFYSLPGENRVTTSLSVNHSTHNRVETSLSYNPSLHSLSGENRVTKTLCDNLSTHYHVKTELQHLIFQSFYPLAGENRVAKTLCDNPLTHCQMKTELHHLYPTIKIDSGVVDIFFTFQIYFYLDRCVHLVVILPPVQLIQFRLDQWDYEVTCMQSYVLYEIHVLYKFYFYVIYIVVNSKQKNVNVFSSLLYIIIRNGFP